MVDGADWIARSTGPRQIDRYVGARIRTARERQATSVEDLAAAVGSSISLIAGYEDGLEKVSPAMLCRIAVTLDVTLGSLFGMNAI
jgi:transcriptional regulator with XRE-family HTH domain